MAIIRPNTRNAFGVPARYSDLASAGLRWTPPPVYRYDAYDVQGDTATLYEEDIDLADYQYNADSYDAAVLPDGYSAITGGDGSFLVGAVDSKLYYRDSGGIGLPTGSPSGVTRVAYQNDDQRCLAIINGVLCSCYMSEGNLSVVTIDDTREWTEVSFVTAPSGAAEQFSIGIADGKLVSVYTLGDPPVLVLSHAQNWKISGGVMSYMPGSYSSFMGISSLVIDGSGYLHHVFIYDHDQIVTLGNTLDMGDGWMELSGYMSRLNFNSSYGVYDTLVKRMYGIQDGRLYSLSSVQNILLPPYKTQITEFSDWWKVVFVAPDEAVAIRRIAL